jgi:4-hydroxy-2-oxoheptanedioate aldolase
MRRNKVKELWKSGKTPAVAWVSTADTYIAETIAYAGFDAVVLDMQHGMTIGPDRAGHWLQAVSTTGAVPFVRIPWNEPYFIQWVLDAGAYGVIVPLVDNPEEASRAGRACRYPPGGYRSNGPNRVRYYAGADYFYHANEEIICLAMIEDIRAATNIEAIAKAPGIDGFYIGPTDFALSMGNDPARFRENPEQQKAQLHVLNTARKAGLIAGIHCWSTEEAVLRHSEGFVFCPAVSDIGALSAASAAALKRVRSADEPQRRQTSGLADSDLAPSRQTPHDKVSIY